MKILSISHSNIEDITFNLTKRYGVNVLPINKQKYIDKFKESSSFKYATTEFLVKKLSKDVNIIKVKNDVRLLLQDVVIMLEHSGKKYEFIIPSGFLWDGASMPFGLQKYLVDAKGRVAYLLHDYLYYIITGKIYAGSDYVEQQEFCDLALREMQKHIGVGFIKRWAIYFVLRMFGHIAFMRYRGK